eukprot:GEMP01029083.1.p1 GENE.GEMP01029083.1~~GEMP01029083.1.p1  ORF type:complete len:401 (+),score=76.92 GEMP01029083.1:463-1665(+)
MQPATNQQKEGVFERLHRQAHAVKTKQESQRTLVRHRRERDEMEECTFHPRTRYSGNSPRTTDKYYGSMLAWLEKRDQRITRNRQSQLWQEARTLEGWVMSLKSEELAQPYHRNLARRDEWFKSRVEAQSKRNYGGLVPPFPMRQRFDENLAPQAVSSTVDDDMEDRRSSQPLFVGESVSKLSDSPDPQVDKITSPAPPSVRVLQLYELGTEAWKCRNGLKSEENPRKPFSFTPKLNAKSLQIAENDTTRRPMWASIFTYGKRFKKAPPWEMQRKYLGPDQLQALFARQMHAREEFLKNVTGRYPVEQPRPKVCLMPARAESTRILNERGAERRHGLTPHEHLYRQALEKKQRHIVRMIFNERQKKEEELRECTFRPELWSWRRVKWWEGMDIGADVVDV